jgi:hypothetical protein
LDLIITNLIYCRKLLIERTSKNWESIPEMEAERKGLEKEMNILLERKEKFE